MGNIAYLNVEMRANTQNFSANIQRSNQKLDRHAKVARRAKVANDSMAQGFTRSANAMAILEGPLGPMSGRLNSVAAGLKTVGVAGMAAGLAVTAGAIGIAKGVTVLMESERQLLRTEALLKSTGNASGYTVGQLDSMARQTALNTLASTEGIRDAQGILLTFKSVNGSVFREAISLAQDMAEVNNNDAKTSIMTLAKALEDPKRGISALTRVGVTFTESEKEMIKSLMEANDLFEAQSMILDKVAGQFGGAGKKAAEGLAGAVDTAAHRFSDLTEELAKFTGSGEGFENLLSRLSRGMVVMTDMMKPEEAGNLFNRRIELITKLAEAREELIRIGPPDDLPDLPLPGVNDKGDWRDQQAAVNDLRKELAEVDKLMQGKIDDQNKIIEGEKKAYEQGLAQQELLKKQAEEAKRIADETERRVKAQKESVRLAKSRSSKKDSLYNRLFDKPDEKKNFKQNREFESSAKAAKRLIDDGFVDGAKRFLAEAEASYRGSKKLGDSYDVSGMKDIIIMLREQAGLEFKDPDKVSRTKKADGEGKSSLELMRANGDHLKLVADNSSKMTEAVNTYLQKQDEALKQANGQQQPAKKFVLEIAVPGKGKKFSINAESKDEFDSQFAELLEGAAAGI